MEPRFIARIIAIIDMTLSVVTTLGLIIMILMVAFNVNNDHVSSGFQGTSIPAGQKAVVFTLTGVFCVLKICASWSLIKGTNDIVEIPHGLRYCRIWRGITIFFVAFNITVCVLWITGKTASVPLPAMIMTVCLIIFHSISIGFVQQYIYQLFRRAVISVNIPITATL